MSGSRAWRGYSDERLLETSRTCVIQTHLTQGAEGGALDIWGSDPRLRPTARAEVSVRTPALDTGDAGNHCEQEVRDVGEPPGVGVDATRRITLCVGS